MANVLSQQQIDDKLEELSIQWAQAGDSLEREYAFDDFASALEFVNEVGGVAEELGHHPDIELGWGRVVLRITSHEAGGITADDFELAQAVDELGD